MANTEGLLAGLEGAEGVEFKQQQDLEGGSGPIRLPDTVNESVTGESGTYYVCARATDMGSYIKVERVRACTLEGIKIYAQILVDRNQKEVRVKWYEDEFVFNPRVE